MHRSWSFFVTAVSPGALLFLADTAVATQVETRLRVEDSGAWSIEVASDAVLRGPWVEQAADIQRLDSARVVFVPGQAAHALVVANVDGSRWTRVGREGQGPGEYSYIRWTVPDRSRLHVFDGMAMRRTVLGADFEVLHTNPLYLNLAGGAAVLGDSTYIVNGSIPTSDRVGYVLHHFGPEGEVLRSFDESPEGYGTAAAGITRYRSVLAPGDGTLWAAHRTRYQIDLWDIEYGELTLSLVRDADWFVPHREWELHHPERPPRPQLLDLEMDSQGRLWVLVSVASARWADGFVNAPEGAHPELGAYVLDDWNVSYDTVLEVIDPIARCVLATKTLDDRVPFFVGPGWGVSYRDDEAGSPTQRLWRLTLAGPLHNTGDEQCN